MFHKMWNDEVRRCKAFSRKCLCILCVLEEFALIELAFNG